MVPTGCCVLHSVVRSLIIASELPLLLLLDAFCSHAFHDMAYHRHCCLMLIAAIARVTYCLSQLPWFHVT